MREAKANIKFLRYSPKKMKILARVYKKKPVHYTLMQLESSSGKGYQLLKEAIKSAAANAVNNFRVDYNTHYIKDILSNEGPRLKRINIRAQGRADRMHRPMMHIAVTVAGEEMPEDIRLRKKSDKTPVSGPSQVKENLEPAKEDSSEEQSKDTAVDSAKPAQQEKQKTEKRKSDKAPAQKQADAKSTNSPKKEGGKSSDKSSKKESKEDKK